MLKKPGKQRARPKTRVRAAAWLRRLSVAGVGVLALAAVLGSYRAAAWIQDTELLAIRHIQVTGERRITESEILARAGYAPGKRVFGVDLDETRRAVEAIPWVRHATIRRVWPDELAITVVERDAETLAPARIDGELHHADYDGVILPMDEWTIQDSPILDGLSAGRNQAEIARNAFKIGIYRDVLDLIGPGDLSEVHVSDGGEVSIVPIDEPLVVMLGATDHGSRWDKYRRSRTRILENYPAAERIDLRFRDQVIIRSEPSGEDGPAEGIPWGEEETNLL